MSVRTMSIAALLVALVCVLLAAPHAAASPRPFKRREGGSTALSRPIEPMAPEAMDVPQEDSAEDMDIASDLTNAKPEEAADPLAGIPDEVRANFKSLPLQVQLTIMQRSSTVPGCWPTYYTRPIPFQPTVCPRAYPANQFGGCYQQCPPGAFGIGERCWAGMHSEHRAYGGAAKCPANSETTMGLCIQNCPSNFTAYGPLCASNLCPAENSFRCAIACTPTSNDCVSLVVEYARYGVRSLIHLVRFSWDGLKQDARDVISNIMAWKMCEPEREGLPPLSRLPLRL